MIITLGAVITNYNKLKDRTFKVTFETGELGGEQLLGLDMLTQKAVFVAIGENPVNFEDIEDDLADIIPKNPREGKSASQRLRAVLYRYWEQFEQKNYEKFDDYYEVAMEKTITKIKDKLS